MKAVHGLLLLLGLLFLLTELPPSMGQVLGKPGRCPSPPPGTVTTCDVRCRSDWECAGNQKCCHYGCSIRCMPPVIGSFP
ncbi:kunitz/BPTI-like toxin [Crotalus adamanteus]|uniref:Kunitz/BPTI-like toxin n=1 Tax=Crotalus adamanteus TaxID=8729 RepID=A0AAW1BST3_CROAD